MGIMQDAGELLIFLYNQYTTNNDQVITQKVMETTSWEAGRINRAIKYLEDIGAITLLRFMGNTQGVHNFNIRGLTPIGVHMIEEKMEFKRNFGFEVGVPGLFSFNWGAMER